MLRKIGFGLLSLAASLCANTYAQDSQTLKPQSVTIEYELLANEPQVFINYMFWTIDANCTITTEDESNELYVVALAKKGKVNDIPLANGQSLRVTVHNGEKMKLSADSGAKVEITNFGEHAIKAVCTS